MLTIAPALNRKQLILLSQEPKRIEFKRSKCGGNITKITTVRVQHKEIMDWKHGNKYENTTKHTFELCVWEEMKHSVNLLNCKLFRALTMIVFFFPFARHRITVSVLLCKCKCTYNVYVLYFFASCLSSSAFSFFFFLSTNMFRVKSSALISMHATNNVGCVGFEK